MTIDIFISGFLVAGMIAFLVTGALYGVLSLFYSKYDHR